MEVGGEGEGGRVEDDLHIGSFYHLLVVYAKKTCLHSCNIGKYIISSLSPPNSHYLHPLPLSPFKDHTRRGLVITDVVQVYPNQLRNEAKNKVASLESIYLVPVIEPLAQMIFLLILI